MADKFSSFTESLSSPPSYLISVSPSDADDLPTASRALNVAETGTVRVTTVGGSTATLVIAAGVTFPIRAQRVWATGTTAAGIVAMY